ANIVADHTIIFIYSPNEYMISVTREMRDGTPILGEPDLSDNVIHGTGFDLTSAQMFINGRTFVDWMLDGILQGNTVVSLTNVVSFHNIVLVYDDASGNNNTGGSGYGNATITGPQGGTSQQPEQRPPEDRLQEPEFEQEPEEQQNGGQQNDGQQNGGQQNGGDEPKQSIIDPLWLAVIMMLLAAAVFILFYLWRDEEEEEERGP
ncbi:MAG: hypothetical protein FWE54_01000, partial [Methanimicrococcus sp.]|nr:hypothetical protein [Methanimicrococcus sp.]